MADGIDADQARRQFGHVGSRFEASRDLRLIPWLDSLRGDIVFAWRQLTKKQSHVCSSDPVYRTCHRRLHRRVPPGRCAAVSAPARRPPFPPLCARERRKTYVTRRHGL
jgi:hypothetical protein